jgi:hypothetical protein
MQRAATRRIGTSILVALLSARPVAAEPAPPASPTEPAQRNDARAEFDRGIVLFEQGSFDRALALFRRSLEMYPTRAAATNAALCLKRLGRFDEALDALEAMRERFGPLPPADQAEYDEEVAELSKQVGTLEVRGIEPGSQVEIDGIVRATAPLGSPLRVSRGEHRLRVTRADRAVVEEHVYLDSGQTVALELHQTAPRATRVTGETSAAFALSSRADEPERPAVTRAGGACRFCVGALGGFVMLPKWGGDVAGSSTGLGVKLLARAEYGLSSTWSLALEGGYLEVATSVPDRSTQAIPTGDMNAGTASDDLKLRGAVFGASVAFRPRVARALELRAGAGAVWASLADQRNGTFEATIGPGMARSPMYEVEQTERREALYAYASLSVELALAVTHGFRAGLGVDVTGFFAVQQPRWDDAQNFLGPNGDSRFASETLSGRFMASITPFADVEYDF